MSNESSPELDLQQKLSRGAGTWALEEYAQDFVKRMADCSEAEVVAALVEALEAAAKGGQACERMNISTRVLRRLGVEP